MKYCKLLLSAAPLALPALAEDVSLNNTLALFPKCAVWNSLPGHRPPRYSSGAKY